MRTALALTAALVLAASAHAQTVSGNPSADGWVYGGNSMENGVYVRGGGIFSYGVYQQNIVLSAGSNLLSTVSGSTWSIGDQVIGLGGVFVTSPTAPAAGWGPGSSYSTSQSTGAGGSASVNGNVTSSLRMVGKFGTDANAWGASSLAPGGGNGLGSTSAGHGGIGAITLGNSVGDITGTASGLLRLPSVAEIYTGSGTVSISNTVGRMVYNYGSGGIVTSWELFLNVTLVQTLYGGSYADLPAFGDANIVTTQRSTNATLFHDAVVPTPGAAAILGLGGLAAARRRR